MRRSIGAVRQGSRGISTNLLDHVIEGGIEWKVDGDGVDLDEARPILHHVQRSDGLLQENSFGRQHFRTRKA